MRLLACSLSISFALHAAFLSLTGVSLPPPDDRAINEQISFYGFLPVSPQGTVTALPVKQKNVIPRQRYLQPLRMPHANLETIKPLLFVQPFPQKGLFAENERFTMPRVEDNPVFLHPLLPSEIQMYFKDRQQVHIQLLFKIIDEGKKNSVVVARKVSSGNLEVDLLCARYIWHYLRMQQSRFSSNAWQTVKIDLSTAGEGGVR